MFEGWLTIAVFLPIAAAVLIALFGRNAVMVKWFAAIVSLVELALTFVIFLLYDTSPGAAQYQLVDKATNWIPVESFRVQYFLAVDGTERPAGAAHRPARNGGDIRLMEHRTPGQRVFRLAARPPGRCHGSVHLAGLLPVLPVLGTGTHTHVLPHIHLGKRAARILPR